MMKKTLSLLALLSGLANYSNAGIIATFDFVPEPDPFFTSTGTATLDDSGVFTISYSSEATDFIAPGFNGTVEGTDIYTGTLVNNTLFVDSALSTATIDSCSSLVGLCSFPDLIFIDGNFLTIDESIGIPASFLNDLQRTFNPIVFDLTIGGITEATSVIEFSPGFTFESSITFVTTSSSQVPEPSSIFLAGAGLLIMSILRRKKHSV